MKYLYSAFGLRLGANSALPGLLPLPCGSGQDLQVWPSQLPPWLAEVPRAEQTIWHLSPYRNERGQPSLEIWKVRNGGYLRFVYDDGAQFVVDRSGSEIWATWPECMTLEDAATYLFGPVLAFVLRLRGLTTLHASAVSVGKAAIAFLGPQGAGKSTTAAALAESGCAVISDDIVALHDDDNLAIQPAHPQLCLWPDSVEALYGAKDYLPPLTPNWGKCYLDLTKNGYCFQRDPLPLRGVYVLGPRSLDAAAPFVESVSPHEGFMALVENSYGGSRLDKQMRAREFDLLGRIAARVPFRRVTPHADAAHLSRLCEVILDDARQLLPR